MKKLISEKLIVKLKPAKKPYEVRDTRLPGFILRVQPSGSISYIVQYARGKRYTIGPVSKLKAEKAREEAASRIADAVKGLDPMEERRKARAHTFKDFIEQEYTPYLSTENFRPSHATEAIRKLKALFPAIGDKKLSEVDGFAFEKYRSARLKAGVSAATTNRELDMVKAAFHVAVDKGFLKTNPIGKVKRFREDEDARVRYLSPDEEQGLSEALEARENRRRAEREQSNKWRRDRGYKTLPEHGHFTDYLKPIILVALNTGLRRGELFNLKQEHIDLVRRDVTVSGRTAKSRKKRHVPLNDLAFDILTKWRQQSPGDELVFPGEGGEPMKSIKTAWAGLMTKASIKDFHFHDCRHDFASKLVMSGVDLYTVCKLLGHSSITITERYAHLAPSKLTAAVAKLGRA